MQFMYRVDDLSVGHGKPCAESILRQVASGRVRSKRIVDLPIMPTTGPMGESVGKGRRMFSIPPTLMIERIGGGRRGYLPAGEG